MEPTNVIGLIAKTMNIFKDKDYSEANIKFLEKLAKIDDTNLRILRSRFFRFSPSDYAIAAILVSDDQRLNYLKEEIENSISDERKDFLSDLIFQLS